VCEREREREGRGQKKRGERGEKVLVDASFPIAAAAAAEPSPEEAKKAICRFLLHLL